ncbi:hypothetical protein M0802_008835 [Mischocyttarus mexicanus]|nr:hypothetical protein M0802_008835 [Mischocyttarus mexicanus]
MDTCNYGYGYGYGALDITTKLEDNTTDALGIRKANSLSTIDKKIQIFIVDSKNNETQAPLKILGYNILNLVIPHMGTLAVLIEYF